MSHESSHRAPDASASSREHVSFSIEINTVQAQEEYEQGNNEYMLLGEKSHPVLFYRESLGLGASFYVYRYRDRWEFQVILDGQKAAEFILRQKPDRLMIEHRLVRPESKRAGINGTLLLQKTEAYVRFLQTTGCLDGLTMLGIDAGQKEVIEWARKNGFRFQTQSAQDEFERLSRGEIAGYRLDVTESFQTEGIYRRGYMMKEDQYEAWKAENEKRVQTGQEPLAAGIMAVRFSLEKDI